MAEPKRMFSRDAKLIPASFRFENVFPQSPGQKVASKQILERLAVVQKNKDRREAVLDEWYERSETSFEMAHKWAEGKGMQMLELLAFRRPKWFNLYFEVTA